MSFLDGTYPSVEAPTSTSSRSNKTYFLPIHISWISLNLSTVQWDSHRFIPPALWLLARSGLTEHPCSKLFSFGFKFLKMVFQPGPGSRDSRSKWPSAHQPPSQVSGSEHTGLNSTVTGLSQCPQTPSLDPAPLPSFPPAEISLLVPYFL